MIEARFYKRGINCRLELLGLYIKMYMRGRKSYPVYLEFGCRLHNITHNVYLCRIEKI